MLEPLLHTAADICLNLYVSTSKALADSLDRAVRILGGYKQGNGIVCSCCDSEVAIKDVAKVAAFAGEDLRVAVGIDAVNADG
ncbi:hypothetical protein U1Q18_035978 [Sarracenia purpurea var. burkii]